MKKMEIKSVGAVSAFKSTIYLTVVPLALFFVIGLFMFLIGVVTQEFVLLGIGISYMIMPVFMIVIYGLFSMLGAVIYNWLAGKFGGLEITVNEKEEPKSPEGIAAYMNGQESAN